MTLGIDFEDTVMADIDCSKCGEPWDAYEVRQAELHGLGDMTLEEARRFCRGEGCPCCGFGSRCPSCAGGGRDLRYAYGPRRCRLCSDTGRVLARLLVRNLPPTTSAATALRVERPAGIWITGYGTAERRIFSPRAFKGLPGELEDSADGPFLERYLRCPEGCWDDLPECSACGGDGSLHVDDPEALAERAARQDIAAWDGDPYLILEKRGLLAENRPRIFAFPKSTGRSVNRSDGDLREIDGSLPAATLPRYVRRWPSRPDDPRIGRVAPTAS